MHLLTYPHFNHNFTLISESYRLTYTKLLNYTKKMKMFGDVGAAELKSGQHFSSVSLIHEPG